MPVNVGNTSTSTCMRQPDRHDYTDGGSCVCIKEAWREPDLLGDVAIDVKLSDKEDERFAAWIMEHRHWTHAYPVDTYSA